jgi:hypothetical protein
VIVGVLAITTVLSLMKSRRDSAASPDPSAEVDDSAVPERARPDLAIAHQPGAEHAAEAAGASRREGDPSVTGRGPADPRQG